MFQEDIQFNVFFSDKFPIDGSDMIDYHNLGIRVRYNTIKKDHYFLYHTHLGFGASCNEYDLQEELDKMKLKVEEYLHEHHEEEKRKFLNQNTYEQ